MICSLVGFVLVGKLFKMSRSGRWTVPASSVSPVGARRPPGPRSERFSLPVDRVRCAAAITRSGGLSLSGGAQHGTERNGNADYNIYNAVIAPDHYRRPCQSPIMWENICTQSVVWWAQVVDEEGGGWDRERSEAGLFSMQLILISFETSNLLSFQNQLDLKFQFSPILLSIGLHQLKNIHS